MQSSSPDSIRESEEVDLVDFLLSQGADLSTTPVRPFVASPLAEADAAEHSAVEPPRTRAPAVGSGDTGGRNASASAGASAAHGHAHTQHAAGLLEWVGKDSGVQVDADSGALGAEHSRRAAELLSWASADSGCGPRATADSDALKAERAKREDDLMSWACGGSDASSDAALEQSCSAGKHSLYAAALLDWAVARSSTGGSEDAGRAERAAALIRWAVADGTSDGGGSLALLARASPSVTVSDKACAMIQWACAESVRATQESVRTAGTSGIDDTAESARTQRAVALIRWAGADSFDGGERDNNDAFESALNTKLAERARALVQWACTESMQVTRDSLRAAAPAEQSSAAKAFLTWAGSDSPDARMSSAQAQRPAVGAGDCDAHATAASSHAELAAQSAAAPATTSPAPTGSSPSQWQAAVAAEVGAQLHASAAGWHERLDGLRRELQACSARDTADELTLALRNEIADLRRELRALSVRGSQAQPQSQARECDQGNLCGDADAESASSAGAADSETGAVVRGLVNTVATSDTGTAVATMPSAPLAPFATHEDLQSVTDAWRTALANVCTQLAAVEAAAGDETARAAMPQSPEQQRRAQEEWDQTAAVLRSQISDVKAAWTKRAQQLEEQLQEVQEQQEHAATGLALADADAHEQLDEHASRLMAHEGNVQRPAAEQLDAHASRLAALEGDVQSAGAHSIELCASLNRAAECAAQAQAQREAQQLGLAEQQQQLSEQSHQLARHADAGVALDELKQHVTEQLEHLQRAVARLDAMQTAGSEEQGVAAADLFGQIAAVWQAHSALEARVQDEMHRVGACLADVAQHQAQEADRVAVAATARVREHSSQQAGNSAGGCEHEGSGGAISQAALQEQSGDHTSERSASESLPASLRHESADARALRVQPGWSDDDDDALPDGGADASREAPMWSDSSCGGHLRQRFSVAPGGAAGAPFGLGVSTNSNGGSGGSGGQGEGRSGLVGGAISEGNTGHEVHGQHVSDLTERAGHLRGAPRALRRGQGDGSESDLASRAWRLSGTVCRQQDEPYGWAAMPATRPVAWQTAITCTSQLHTASKHASLPESF